MKLLGRCLRIMAGITGRGPRERRLRAAVAGRTVLITGASEGIGAATARRLAAAGATVLLVARTAERLDEVRAEIEAAGGRAVTHPADLSSPEAAAALGAELVAGYQRIDVVVSNAGRSIRRSVADTADRFHDIQRTIGVNHLGPVQLLLVLLPAMRAAGGGHIVNVSTAGLSLHTPNWSAYHSSKAAFDTWLRGAAVELRRDHVTVSTAYLNLVRTRMSAPTAHYARAPMMSAAEAAEIVCRSVAHRRSWSPWWARLGAVISAMMPRTVERALAAGVRAIDAAEPLRVLAATGLWRPARLLRLLRAGRRHGRSLATALAAGPPGGIALVDADGPVTYPELDVMAAACAAGAAAAGVRPGDRVGLACGGHRGFVAAAAGLSRLGADVVLLPPDLPGERLEAVARRERIGRLVHEPGALTAGLPATPWPDLISSEGASPGGRVRPGNVYVLTSGTTGVPRAVSRPLPLRMLLGPVTTHLRLTPVRPGEPIVVATPPHHGYGLTYLSAGLTLGAPVVLVPGGDPERILNAVAANRAGLLFALPVQLRRVCDLPDAAWPDLGSLRAVVSGAAPLDAGLCRRLRERLGDRTFNMYATTEAGWAAMATPADLRAAPGTVGRAPRGVRVRIAGADGVPLPLGRIGEIRVRGWHPDGRWHPTGDLGHLDPAGRLFVDGRLDDMIVSGGENVYPGPVAAVITGHPDVTDVLLEPVADSEFGRRLRATVEIGPGRTLTAGQLREWLTTRLSRAERPKEIIIVTELRRTATGKPLRDGPRPATEPQ
ncbi:SDR family NAD(P)-dependent oxidoreductase [Actinoplanes flavus]|uniref:SDR family NAD(P)-dependent oxidoreductase n=1 Tax=Actinoplanes flavus TaxID=2820290 RepID=A0ABS3UGI1_9ACTN|nr:SDR family NAD(P)-dependent oxidoreductase [Actinoplanes flavus]MBO3737546.1 SDR family NAD(P)-dependent oxidoreductase [Actinoplanes flavus]